MRPLVRRPPFTLAGIRGKLEDMDFGLGNRLPYHVAETASFVLLILALGAAIFFWGRGIRRSRLSDLIAGPAILVALCCLLSATNRSSGVFGLIGELVIVFGIATLFLSALVRPDGKFSRRDVIAIGVGAIIVGFFSMLII